MKTPSRVDDGTPPGLPPHALQPRTLPYRDRAGRITAPDGRHVADVYLKTEVYWRRCTIDGRLEWTDPSETLHGYALFADGSFQDFVTAVDLLTDELARWDRGLWTMDGDVMHVEWLDDVATSEFRSKHGFAPPDFA